MKKKFIYVLALSIALVSCKKEKALNVDLTKTNPSTYVPGKIDKWLTDNFLNPYNMEVLYRFDRFQAKIDKDLIPVREDQIQPAMEAVRDVWIEPYMAIAGKNFLKPFIPKQIALVGSAEYNIDGSITLGTADAGRRINLFTINDYDKTNIPKVEEMLHTIHHEFTHILHQNIPVPADYESISPEYVGGSWVSFTNTAELAKSLGYITRYSRMNKDEDFAEVTSFMLVEGRDAFDIYTNSASVSADARLRKKEQIVINYFKGNYGIDFRALQAKVKAAKETLTGASRSFRSNLVAGAYKGFSVDKNAVSQSADFVTAYNNAVAAVVAGFGISIDSKFELEFANLKTNKTDFILKLTGKGPGFAGSFWYNLKATINATTGDVKFVLAPAGTGDEYGNGTAVQARLKPLLDYLTVNTFNVNWVDESVIANSKDRLAGFTTNSDSKLGFYGSIKR